MLAGACNMYVEGMIFSDMCSGRFGFIGGMGYLWDPVCCVRRPSPYLVYSLCEEFGISVDSFLKGMQV